MTDEQMRRAAEDLDQAGETAVANNRLLMAGMPGVSADMLAAMDAMHRKVAAFLAKLRKATAD